MSCQSCAIRPCVVVVPRHFSAGGRRELCSFVHTRVPCFDRCRGSAPDSIKYSVRVEKTDRRTWLKRAPSLRRDIFGGMPPETALRTCREEEKCPRSAFVPGERSRHAICLMAWYSRRWWKTNGGVVRNEEEITRKGPPREPFLPSEWWLKSEHAQIAPIFHWANDAMLIH